MIYDDPKYALFYRLNPAWSWQLAYTAETVAQLKSYMGAYKYCKPEQLLVCSLIKLGGVIDVSDILDAKSPV